MIKQPSTDNLSSLFHLQFATSFHRLKSPLFWRWNFAKRMHKSKENRCFGLKCNFASHPRLISPSQVTFVPILIKGEMTLNRRWCDFTKQIYFSPLFCRRNAMSFQPLKSPSYHCRNGTLFSNQHFRNSGEMRQKVIQIFKTVAKYNGESPSKIETKTNILQISKQWHISLSHRQQNFVQDFSHWVLKLVKDGL